MMTTWVSAVTCSKQLLRKSDLKTNPDNLGLQKIEQNNAISMWKNQTKEIYLLVDYIVYDNTYVFIVISLFSLVRYKNSGLGCL